MKTLLMIPLYMLLMITTAFGAQEAAEQAMPMAHGEMKTFSPDKMEWQEAKALPPGAKIAVLEGDLKSGPFTFQLRLPANYTVPPHWHPMIEHVTVLSGEFKIAMGEKWDDSKLQAMPAGSFMYMPPKMPHFAKTNGETVVQVHGSGQWEIIYIDPKDDPRKKM